MKKIEEVIDLYRSVYYLKDKDTDMIPLIIAIVVQSKLEGKPVGVWLVGGSSAGKTALIDALGDLPFVREISMLTENTLLSGAVVKGQETSLLKIIGEKGGVITFKDFTTMSKDKTVVDNKDNLDNFFGDMGYSIPETSNYLKFKEGSNTFRVLSSAVTGYEYWNNDNEPLRSKTEPTEKVNAKADDKGKVSVKHFWAMAVWNYDAKRVQILQVTQKAIMKYMKNLIDNKAWGTPKNYDLCVTKEGSGLTTEYSVVANPPSPVDPSILEAYSKMNIDLEALFVGGEPIK